MRRFACLLLMLSTPAFAQPEPTPTPTPEPTPAPSGSNEADALWKQKYNDAKNKLITGEFAEAAAAFDELAKSATDPIDRALAAEQAGLAHEWAARNLAFVHRSDLAEVSISAKAVDKRTADEIAGLYTLGFVYGLGTGLWIDAVTQPESTAGIVLPPLIGAGLGIAGVAILDSGRGLRYGVPSAISAGLIIGLDEGTVWTLWNQSQRSGDRWSTQGAASVVWGLSTVGAIAGGLVGSSVPITPGRALFVQAGALWGGAVLGLGMGALAADPHGERAGYFAAGVGTNVGWVGAALAAGSVSPSSARVQLVNVGGIAGFLLFGGIYLAAADKNPNVHAEVGAAALGSAAGLTAAWFITARMAPDMPRAPNAPPAAVSNVVPAITPVQGGATVGVSGTLF
jgi:hypothetical protein